MKLVETLWPFTFVAPDKSEMTDLRRMPPGMRGVYSQGRVTISEGPYKGYYAPGVTELGVTPVSPLKLLAEVADD